MRRALALAFVFALSRGASAQEIPTVPKALPKPPTTPFVLAGARYLELNAAMSMALDSNARTDAPADVRAGRTSFTAGVDLGFPFAHQRLRPSLFGGVQVGYWGDDAHGPVSAYVGTRFRASFYMDDIFDLYALLRADVPISPAGAALRPGAGIGLRVGRVVSLEGSYDTLFALGTTFANTQYTSFVPVGFTVSLMIDTCLGCTRSSKRPVNRNMACRLYELAKDVSTPDVRKPICDAVPHAMEASPDPLTARRQQDGAAVFLDALAAGLATEPKKAVVRLVDMHDALLGRLSSYERVAAANAAQGLALAERWSYAPVPAELRAYLGCEATLPPPCTEITPGD